ncbi:MAG TPA: tetratricopeptide repeat protein [Ktedonobacteraceae bacterium]|jgi:tetratricopeptide (TPR) repeat protein
MTEVEQGRISSDWSTANQTSLATIFMHKGSVLYDLDLQETALVAYEQAIQLAPYEAILHLHRGHALEQMGRQAEAQNAYEEAQRLGYDFASLYEEERQS